MKNSLRYLLASHIANDEDFISVDSPFAFYKIYEPLTVNIKGKDFNFKKDAIIMLDKEPTTIDNYRLLFASPSITSVAKHLFRKYKVKPKYLTSEDNGVKYFTPYYTTEVMGESVNIYISRKFTAKADAVMSALIQIIKDKSNA